VGLRERPGCSNKEGVFGEREREREREREKLGGFAIVSGRERELWEWRGGSIYWV